MFYTAHRPSVTPSNQGSGWLVEGVNECPGSDKNFLSALEISVLSL